VEDNQRLRCRQAAKGINSTAGLFTDYGDHVERTAGGLLPPEVTGYKIYRQTSGCKKRFSAAKNGQPGTGFFQY